MRRLPIRAAPASTHVLIARRLPCLRSARLKVMAKVQAEYRLVKDLPPPTAGGAKGGAVTAGTATAGAALAAASSQAMMLTDNSGASASAGSSSGAGGSSSTSLILSGKQQPATAPMASAGNSRVLSIRRHNPVLDVPKPEWHAPWKLMRVVSGHMGWVRAIAVDPTNEWFVTGSADRTIKVWDLASGVLKLTLTGHISTVRGLAISPRSPYLFSAGEDKMVKCWDLEYNRVIRHYHGHLSGVYCASLHPTLDLLVTGGRDCVARVWDVRTKNAVHTLCGHQQTVAAVETQALEPQVITGSMDGTIRLWDLVAGRASAVLTNHKKAVRALALHPSEYTFASASADNMKKWKCPEGKFLHNISGANCIVNALAVNEDGVMVSGSDNGYLHFYDWKSGHNFHTGETIAQPGSLEGERGIYAMKFDLSGSRLITCEADKTIKFWKEDPDATPESHPLNWEPPRERKRY